MNGNVPANYHDRIMAAAGAVRVAALLAAIWFATQIADWIIRVVLQIR